MLYIVGTPIGNLDDISLRQAKTLLSSDIILAEDTRSAGILLDACRLRFQSLITNHQPPKLISYYKEKEFEKLPYVIDELKHGKIISLISESGLPLISDPGYLLVRTAIKESLPMMVIPGPAAYTTAVLYSGFKADTLIFLGFLPKRKTEKTRLLKRMKQVREVLEDASFEMYESPDRINETFQCMIDIGWDPDIVVCRELTKKFEEIIRGKVKDLLTKNFRGELTIVIK